MFKTLPVIFYCSHANKFKHFLLKKLKTEFIVYHMAVKFSKLVK